MHIDESLENTSVCKLNSELFYDALRRFLRQIQHISIPELDFISARKHHTPKSFEKLRFIGLGDQNVIAVRAAIHHIFICRKKAFSVKIMPRQIHIAVVSRMKI